MRGSTLTAAVDALDPELDDERIVDLTTNWLYANPLLYTLTYTLVFLRQASVPGIAEILDRDGRGPTVRSPHVRNVATMSCFGIWFRHGYRSARGQQAIDRVNAVHARFPINQDQYRYVLATQIFEPERLLTLVGAQPLTATENQARFVFWRNLGQRLGIGGIPATFDGFRAWMIDYERENCRYTFAAGRIATALRGEWVHNHLPAPLRPLGRSTLDALVDPDLGVSLGISPPHVAVRWFVHSAVRGYLRLLTEYTPSARRYTTGFGPARAAVSP